VVVTAQSHCTKGMEFYWDVFAASFFLVLLGIILAACFFRTVVLCIIVLHSKRTQKHQSHESKRNVAHLLGVPLTWKQIHQRKKDFFQNCDVCSICLVRLFTSSATFLIHQFCERNTRTNTMCTMVSGDSKQTSGTASATLFTLLPPKVHRKLVSHRTLFKRRERRVPAVQTRCLNGRNITCV